MARPKLSALAVSTVVNPVKNTELVVQVSLPVAHRKMRRCPKGHRLAAGFVFLAPGLKTRRSAAVTKKPRDYSAEAQTFRIKNNIPKKQWVTAGSNPCKVCQANAAQGPINSSDNFASGHLHDPACDGCECYVDDVDLDLSSMSNEELDSLIIWGKPRKDNQ